MKVRVSATIDKETDKLLDEFLKKSKFRNKSHLIEEAITNFIQNDSKKK